MSRIISSSEALNIIVSKLKVYDDNEKRSIAYLLMEKLYGVQRSASFSEKVVVFNEEQVENLAKKINNFHPIQYLLEETEFYGSHIKVSPDVLIPRPETEELVDLVIKEQSNKKELRMLDIGTGSGCIAIALSKNLPGSTIFALDVNVRALKAAYHNSVLNNSKVIFFQHDLFSEEKLPVEDLDIIVSNPPYVTHSEKSLMLPNVIDFEPAQALFVPDSDPLIFYRRIIKKTTRHLKKDAVFYFEINEKYGKELLELLEVMGIKEAEIRKDLSGKDRFIVAKNSPEKDIF